MCANFGYRELRPKKNIKNGSFWLEKLLIRL